jgi:hypothetical protein
MKEYLTDEQKITCTISRLAKAAKRSNNHSLERGDCSFFINHLFKTL